MTILPCVGKENILLMVKETVKYFACYVNF